MGGGIGKGTVPLPSSATVFNFRHGDMARLSSMIAVHFLCHFCAMLARGEEGKS